MNILKRLAKLLTNFPMKSIFITIGIVVLFVFGARNIFMATGNDTLVESSTDVYQDNLMLEDEFGGESIMILYEAENFLTPDTLAHMKGLENALQNSDSIYSMISPVTLVEKMARKQSDTFQKGTAEMINGLDEMGSQLSETNRTEQKVSMEKGMQPLPDMQEKQQTQTSGLDTPGTGLPVMGEKLQTISKNMENISQYSDIMTPGLPKKQATLDRMIYEEDGTLRPMFAEVVVDDTHMLMMIKLKGGTDDTKKSEVIETINNYLENEPIDSTKTLVSGKPVLDHAIKSSMKESIQKMMGLALLIMILVLFFVFKVRGRLLPLVTVLVAVIGTVGLMGWLQIPITMVSMAVFPILIGLGIDYAIQFQNRYEEEMNKEEMAKEAYHESR
jgi:predicted RND superfamily exporter protein